MKCNKDHLLYTMNILILFPDVMVKSITGVVGRAPYLLCSTHSLFNNKQIIKYRDSTVIAKLIYLCAKCEIIDFYL